MPVIDGVIWELPSTSNPKFAMAGVDVAVGWKGDPAKPAKRDILESFPFSCSTCGNEALLEE
jgi:hypothetical protein